MLKNLLSLVIAVSIGSSLAYAGENIVTSNESIKSDIIVSDKLSSVLDNLISGYVRPELSDEDKKYQAESIAKIDELYFNKQNYNQKELNELFINFISIGLNDAADHILNNENVVIDPNGTNDRGLTPLMASAASKMEGGNAEYAVKLIKMGADVNKSTEGTQMSPTSFAAITDNYKVLAILIASGAKFMREDKFDYRPIDYALANNSERSAEILAESLSARIKKEEAKKNDIK